MSHFLYIHKDLSGKPDVWKLGVTLTPYSAVRSRQKFCWEQFGLDYLWIGNPNDVLLLEQTLKQHLKGLSGKSLQGFGTQTELFKVPINQLLDYISLLIRNNNLQVKQVSLKGPYTASNSSSCPFGIPSEKDADEWLRWKVNELFKNEKYANKQKIKLNKNTFNDLFEEY